MQSQIQFHRYEEAHKDPQGPGDGRPTAFQIIKDEGIEAKLSDKTIIVTGASSGIGIETVRALAKTGAHVVLGVRNVQKGQAVIDALIANNAFDENQLELLIMDLNSLTSVREAAEVFLSKHKQLNILVNNAGIGGNPKGTTEDGYESHFGVNHLAHFLLFELLKPLLLASSTPQFNSRLVVVSSLIHRFSPTILDDPNMINMPYNSAIAYASSKTANIWFANEVERRYGSKNLHAISLQPGAILSGLQDHFDEEYAKLMKDTFEANPELAKLLETSEQGAATTVLAAIGKAFEGVGGIYLENCSVVAMHDPEKDLIYAPGYAKYAFDEQSEKRLWQISSEMVGLKE